MNFAIVQLFLICEIMKWIQQDIINYWNNFNCRTWWSLWRKKWAVWYLRRRSNVLELPTVSGMFSEDVWMFWRPSMYLVCAIDFRNFSKFVISFAFGEEFCDTLPLMLVLFLFSIARDSLQKNTMESKPSWCCDWID